MTDGNPMEQFVFNRAAETLVAWAINQNEEARKRREAAVANWLLNAAVNEANKQPLPPQPPAAAKLIKVTVPTGTADQDTLLVEFGPNLVSDLVAELPEPIVTVHPPGVTAIGWDYGDVFAALDNDTQPNGALVPWKRANGDPITLLKHYIPFGQAGALFAKINFYEVVKA